MKDGLLKRARYRFEYLAFRSFTMLLDLVGPRTAALVADTLAAFVVHVLPHRWTRTHVAAENVRRAFPDRDEEGVNDVLRGMWRHIILLLVEIAQVSRRMNRGNVNRYIRFAGEWERNHELLFDSDRPVIQIGGHLGNWEVGSIAFGHRGLHMGVVARVLDNPLLDEWFRRLREQSGHEFLSKNDDYARIVEILAAGGRLGMLCDQDAGPKGQFVPFLGKPASTFRSIALLAIQHRAYICVGYSCRVPGGPDCDWFLFELGNVDIIDATEYDDADGVARLTARFTAALERAVRAFPEQYFWLHRRWKTPPNDRTHRANHRAHQRAQRLAERSNPAA